MGVREFGVNARLARLQRQKAHKSHLLITGNQLPVRRRDGYSTKPGEHEGTAAQSSLECFV